MKEMEKPVVFVLICLVWGWTPSPGTTVISPAAELGKCSTWLSLLKRTGLALETLARMRAFVSLGAMIAVVDMEGAWALISKLLPPYSLTHPFWLVELSHC